VGFDQQEMTRLWYQDVGVITAKLANRTFESQRITHFMPLLNKAVGGA
jgi:hypothetical protein